MLKRVGIFDPTCDPPHIGHLMTMEQARISLNLERVVITSPSDHVNKRYVVHKAHRLEMLRRLIPDRVRSHYEIVEELAVQEMSYFTDQLTGEAHRRYPDAVRYYIMGSDNLIGFAQWGNHDRIIAHAHLAIVPRGDDNVPAMIVDRPGDAPELLEAKAWLRDHYVDHCTGEPRMVILPPAVRMDISTAFVRQSLARGADISFLVTEPVQQYIAEHQLYRPK